MKICFIADANSHHSLRWISYFLDKGHDIHWISCSRFEGELPPKIKFYLIKNPRSKLLKIIINAIAVKKIIKKINPDILHAHYAGVNGALGLLSGFHPFVLTAWGSDVLVAARSAFVRPIVAASLRSADLITCDAFHLKNRIVEIGIAKEKIKTINFGVETNIFCPGIPDDELQNRLRIKNKFSVISVRSLEPIYDIDTLVKAAAIVIKKNPETMFVIGGRGSLEDQLKKQACDLDIEKNIAFAGFIPHNDLPKWFRCFDAYVSTSLSDAGIAGSTAEAMSCGIPVIISDSAENDKWIKNGQNGFLFPVKDSSALAKNLMRLANNKELRQSIGSAGRETIIDRNDYGNEMAKMENLYFNVLDRYGNKNH